MQQAAALPVHATHSPFRINPALDVPALAAAYAAAGRVRVFGLLSEGADYLYEFLESSPDWIHLINHDKGVLELDGDERAELSAEAWAEIEAAALRRARTGFQYRYEGLRVPSPEEYENSDLPLIQFAELMRSREMLDLLRAITGEDGNFADGQATAYGPGDFLTGHDDDVHGQNRLAAYVMGLTPAWRIEWGGLLLFHGADGGTADALAPRFNTLDLFRVPQQHSVSLVSAAAPRRRFAITGWLRRHGLRG